MLYYTTWFKICVFLCVVQAVKFEPYHDSGLVRFLLKTALRVSRATSVSLSVLQCWQFIMSGLLCMCLCVFQSIHLSSNDLKIFVD